MKRASCLFLIVATLVTSCSSKQTSSDGPPTFQGATSEEGLGGRRKLVMKFTPDVPRFDVVHNRDNTMSEVRWQSNSPAPFRKEFTFAGKGVNKALVIVDPKTQQGTMTLWHDSSDSYTLAKDGTDLVLVPDDPFRHTASKNEKRQKLINLSVKQAPLDKVLRTLAAESNKSLVLGSTVNGTVSVTLQNLPYEQALDMILRPTGYRAEHAGDITIIRSAKEDKTFRSYRMRYVDVNVVLKTIQDIASKDAQISADANTNTIFVVDRFEALKNLEILIAQIDQEPRQVEVEAAVLEIDSNNNFDFGIDWSGTLHTGKTQGGLVTNNVGTKNLTPGDGTKGFFVGLTWQSVNAVMTALSSRGKLNLLARPRVLALTDQEAQIILGSKLGYKTVTVTTTGTVEDIKFLVVGTQLKIKPHITENNDILMYIKPEISDGSIDARTGVPSENTTTSETKVMARNGQTIVLGGLLRDRIEKTTQRIPVLGDLPVVGGLFGGTSTQTVKSEVVIMLSPKVVTNELMGSFDKAAAESMSRFYDEHGMENPVPAGHIAPRE